VFAGQEGEATALTDEAGLALAPHMRPIRESGPLEIRVAASHAGEFAHKILHQMNLATAPTGEAELNVVRLDQDGERRPNQARVRVETGQAGAVAAATLVFIVRRVLDDGRTEEVGRSSAISGPDGTATAVLPRAAGKHLELVVRAEAGGRRATRKFPLD
jgi:hypothetical protein